MKSSLRYVPRFLLGATGALVMSFLLSLPMMCIAAVTSAAAPNYYLTHIWVWVVSTLFGVSYSLHQGEKADPKQSYIVAPNHQSNVDILALLAMLPVKYRWVVKQSLLKIPFFGWGLGATGAISIDRSNPKQALEKLRAESGKVGGGWSVLVYPEGTRSPHGNLQPFKKGAFMMAVQTGVPILPVAVNGAYKIMPRNTLIVRPGHITVTLCDPIPTEGLTEEDIPQLMEKTRKAIEDHFDPDYDPFTRRSGAE